MIDNIRVESAEKIDDYIKNVDCDLKKRKSFEINGKRVELQVYRLPLDLLCYNIQNGRFAAELMEKEERLGRRLNPENPQDKKIIEEMLLADKKQKEYLTKDLGRLGQLEPGVITHDGRIINGNRRIAVLKQLVESTGDEKYNYFEVVRLPQKVSHKDLWRIEAGIQLSFDLQASYGPINELLKIKQGKDASLSNKQIALILGGGNTEKDIKLKLDRLTLIEDYLKYVDQPKKYSEAERRNEYFINLQSIMKAKDWKNLSPKDQTRFLHATYENIRAMVGHMRIRSFRRIIKDKDTLNGFISEVFETTTTPESLVEEELEDTKIIDDLDGEEELIKDIIEEPTKQETTEIEFTEEAEKKPKTLSLDTKKTREKLIETIKDSVDKAEAKEESTKPRKLIHKAYNIIKTLSEIDIVKLKPLKKDLEDMSKSIQTLIGKIKS